MRIVRSWLALCVLSSALFAGDNVFLGTWKLNTFKSEFSRGAEINSMTIKFEADNAGVRRTVEGTDGEGKPLIDGRPEDTSIPWDGKEHQVQAPAPNIAVMVKQLSSHSLTAIVKTSAKVTERVKSAVSKDGKTLIIDDAGVNQKGVRFHNVEVFDRQ